MVSHELRTPSGRSCPGRILLRSGRLDAGGTTRAIETIDRNARLQAQLINDLLDVSRINAGKLGARRLPRRPGRRRRGRGQRRPAGRDAAG